MPAAPTQPVVAKLYLRYDCASETLFALVLGVDGTQFQQTRPENAYIRIDGAGKAVSGEERQQRDARPTSRGSIPTARSPTAGKLRRT